jgi:release factor glutamine methyltransferase
MTVAELLAAATAGLAPRDGLADPRSEARFLLARRLGRPESWVLAHGEAEVAQEQATELLAWIRRRAAGEPAHRIVGSCPFFGREFALDRAVLVPRPETELVVDRVIASPLPERPAILDVGTGSGCLAVTLALELPGAWVVATDLSLPALTVARANARHLGATINLIATDLARGLGLVFDVVVANLPYVPAASIAGLTTEVRDHEPTLALDGGPDGTSVIRRLLGDLSRLLRPDGLALLELGPDQATALADATRKAGLVADGTIVDVGGVERVLVLRRGASGPGAPSSARARSAP